MYCKKCGKQISSNSRYCKYCGAVQDFDDDYDDDDYDDYDDDDYDSRNENHIPVGIIIFALLTVAVFVFIVLYFKIDFRTTKRRR